MQKERKNLWASNFPAPTTGELRFDFSGANSAAGGSEGSAAPKRERKPRKAVGTPGKRIAINSLVTLLVGAVYFYLELPAINLHTEEFYGFVLLLCAVYCGCAAADLRLSGRGGQGLLPLREEAVHRPVLSRRRTARACRRRRRGLVGRVPRRGSYQKLLTVQSGDFSSEIAEVAYDQHSHAR